MRDTRRRAAVRLLICAILAAEIFLLLPATLYVGNLVEFAASGLATLRTLFVPALALLLVLVIAGGLVERRGPGAFVAMIAALGVLAWIQAFLLVWDYGPLDGHRIDWSREPWRGWLDGAVWTVVLFAAWRFHRLLERPLSVALGALFIMQSGVLAAAAVDDRAALLEKFGASPRYDALPAMPRFSERRNVLHLILDSFQSDIFREIVTAGPGAQRYRSALDGFTFYEENSGVFPYTYFALPAILSGRIYRNDRPKKEFIREVFSGDTLLSAAAGAGFEVDIATEPLMLDMMANGPYTNAYLVPGQSGPSPRALAVNEAAKLLDLSLFRLAPHFLKRHVYNDERWLVQRATAGPEHLRYFYFAHNLFLHEIAKNMSADRPAPVYKFFHVMSPHAPMVVDDQCAYTGGAIERNRETVTWQSRCTLEFVIDLLGRMKELGIYDDALIVLMADHGGHIPPDRYRPPDPAETSRGFVMNPWVVAMASPLLLIKLPGASGPLRTSPAQTSALDTAATVGAILGLKERFPGTDVLGIEADAVRERRFYQYTWRRADYVTDYILPIQELLIRGSLYENDSWSFGEVFEPPDAKTEKSEGVVGRQ
jgi:hypothetical protein